MSNTLKNMNVRDFMADIAANEVLPGKQYNFRIEIDDGGINSYIGFAVDLDDWKVKGKIKELRLFRHTNNADGLSNTWSFYLGAICNEYHANPDIPLQFSSYGKTPSEAEAEAAEYFNEIRRLVRKQTSDYKIRLAETAQEEREKLLARLSELEGVINE